MRWLLLLLIALPVRAANICVGPSATGNGSGSDWNNKIAYSSLTFVRGNTYYIADGAYTARSWSTANSGTTRIIVKKAIASDHGTDTGWVTAIMGSGQGVFNGQCTISSDYWTFDGQTGGGPGSWKTGFGFRVNVTEGDKGSFYAWTGGLTHGLLLRHFEVHGPTSHSANASTPNMLFLFGVANTTIEYFWGTDSGNDMCDGGGTNVTFQYCYFGYYNWSPTGTHAEVMNIFWNGGQANWTIRWSIVGYGKGTGLFGMMDAGGPGGYEFYGDVFVPLEDDFITSNGLIFNAGTYNTTGLKVYNCTFILWDRTYANRLLGFNTGTSWTADFRNNLMYSGTHYGNATGANPNAYNHFVDCSAGTFGSNATTGSGDPFVNWSGGDFSLKANTTSGVNLGAPYNTDMFGNTRSSWTRGAIEFNGVGAAPVITSSLSSTGTNTISYTYQITANNAPTVFGASPLPTGLAINTSSGLISGTPNVNSPPTTNNVTITATNATGFDSKTLVLIVNPPAATIGVIATNSLFEIYTNGTKDYAFVVTNAAGVGTLTGAASTASPWSIIGNANYSLTTGNTTNITVRYAPTSVKVDSNAVAFTGGGGLTNIITGWAYPVFTGSTFAASNGLVLTPFTTNAGYIVQTNTTFTPADGGRAAYGFKTSGSGTLTISGTVDAQAANSNSFFIQIDAEPTDPLTIWDITSLATNFVSRVVGWRGSGTDVAPQFQTNIWSVPDANVHEIIIRGRENNTALKNITLTFVPTASVPGIPLSFATTATNDSSLTFSWLPPSSDGGSAVGGYKIYRGLTSGGETLYTNLAAVMSWTNNGLANGTPYYYVISATNSVGEGGQSSEIVGIPSKLPSAPLNLKVTPGYSALYLFWDAPADNGGTATIGYYIYKGYVSGGVKSFDRIVYSPSDVDTTGDNGVTVFYAVSAFNENGESAQSNEASGTPLSILASTVIQGNARLQGKVISQ